MLIVNASHILQKIISAYVSTELSDVIITTASTTAEGLNLLKSRKYDIVLSSLEMADMDGLELRWEMSKTGLNADTPFIIMTSTATPAQKEKLAQEGVKHALYAPYTSQDLARVVNLACDPRGMRRQKRYSIPETTASFSGGLSTTAIRVVNLSLTGLLMELPYREDLASHRGISTLALTFPREFGGETAPDLEAVACRTWVLSWRNPEVPEVLRIAWKFVKIPPAAEVIMERVMDEADRQHAFYEEDDAAY
jgi:CheY-like chemotaxis protein